MEERNVGSLQELLALIQGEKPKEYNDAKRSYEDELVQKRLRELDIHVFPEDFRPDFENRNMIDIQCRIPCFEVGVEHSVCPGDIELKIEVGYDYDESVDGPLYSGKLNFEGEQAVSVDGIFENKCVFVNANISFQANIPNYVSGTSYCVRDEETGVIFKFEYNLVKRRELESDHSNVRSTNDGEEMAAERMREERVAMMMQGLAPWTKEKTKKDKEPETPLFPHIIEEPVLPPSPHIIYMSEEEKEKIARDKLKHCKLFAGYTEKDAVIDAIISDPNNSVTNARDMVKIIKEKEPAVYREMEASYATANTVAVQPAVSMSR